VELNKARALATQLMREHGLGHWVFAFDRAKARAGACRPGRLMISLSAPLTLLHEEDDVRDTILHEIAHALVGPHHHHDQVWRAKALELGCSGRRCVDSEAGRVQGAWVGTCPAGHEVQQHRRPTRVTTCRVCSPTFNLAHMFGWLHHGRPEAMHPAYLEELAALRRADGRTAVVRRLGVGTRVRITVRGKFHGVIGDIAKIGRTRYHVRVQTGLLTVPFSSVQRVSE